MIGADTRRSSSILRCSTVASEFLVAPAKVDRFWSGNSSGFVCACKIPGGSQSAAIEMAADAGAPPGSRYAPSPAPPT